MKQCHLIFSLVITLLMSACANTSRSSSVMDIVTNAQYSSETKAYSTWAGRTWEFTSMEGGKEYQALATSVSVTEFDSIIRLITSEFGDPTYKKETLPNELRPKEDTGVFWMASKDNDQFYYWCKDTLVIGIELVDSKPSDIGYSYLYINIDPLREQCMN